MHQGRRAVVAVDEGNIVAFSAAAAADGQEALLVAFYGGVLAAEAEGFLDRVD